MHEEQRRGLWMSPYLWRKKNVSLTKNMSNNQIVEMVMVTVMYKMNQLILYFSPCIPFVAPNPNSLCASGLQSTWVYVASSPMLPPAQWMKTVPGQARRVWLRTTLRCGICCRRRRTGSAVAWSSLRLRWKRFSASTNHVFSELFTVQVLARRWEVLLRKRQPTLTLASQSQQRLLEMLPVLVTHITSV